jgi:hypothetical protein
MSILINGADRATSARTRIKIAQVPAVKPTAAAAGEGGPSFFPYCTSSIKPAMVAGEIR